MKVGGGEILTQPSPAKPTWAQILNSNPNPPSNAAAASSSTTNSNPVPPGNNTPSSSSPSSQHSVPTKNISPSASGTLNMSGTRGGGGGGYLPNYYEQSQSSMNWPLKFNQNSSWMINDDDSQRPPTNASQDNTQMGRGDGTN